MTYSQTAITPSLCIFLFKSNPIAGVGYGEHDGQIHPRVWTFWLLPGPTDDPACDR